MAPWGWLLIVGGVVGLVYTLAASHLTGVAAPVAAHPSIARDAGVVRAAVPGGTTTGVSATRKDRDVRSSRLRSAASTRPAYSKTEDAVVLDPGSAADVLMAGPQALPSEQRSRMAEKPERPVPVSAEEFSSNPRATGAVALTFDGSYDDAPVDAILAALQEKGWHATFFITGRFAERFPSAVRRISDAGMEIGNHSWAHPYFTTLSEQQIRSELTRTGALLERLSGRRPTLFRPPSGDRDARVLKIVASEGYHTVRWELDSLDSALGGRTLKEIRDRVLSEVEPGDVVLMHIGSKATADALPEILAVLSRRGIKVVPVGELMGLGDEPN